MHQPALPPTSSACLPPRPGSHLSVHATYTAVSSSSIASGPSGSHWHQTPPSPRRSKIRPVTSPAPFELNGLVKQWFICLENESLWLLSTWQSYLNRFRWQEQGRKIIKGEAGEMLTLLLLKCCRAFGSRIYTGDANGGVWFSWADYLSCTHAHPTASLPINLIKQLPLARQKNN